MKTYGITEIFYSLQGEGVRAGTANVFIRFAGCNLDCKMSTHSFNCDTDFGLRFKATAKEIVAKAIEVGGKCRWVVLTGGEPLLQADDDLIDNLRAAGYLVAVETNGTQGIIDGFAWVCVSPKLGEPIREHLSADEVKLVLRKGDSLPPMHTLPIAQHYLVSPAFEGKQLIKANLEHAIELIRQNPAWRLSVQQHKGWGVG